MSPPTRESNGCLANAEARSVYRYLREQLGERDADEYYFKCKEIADDLGMTPKEIGSYVRQLRDADVEIRIEKWSWARATTWRVRYRDSD